eukprot:745810-Hanusia_phi.AAC.2
MYKDNLAGLPGDVSLQPRHGVASEPRGSSGEHSAAIAIIAQTSGPSPATSSGLASRRSISDPEDDRR